MVKYISSCPSLFKGAYLLYLHSSNAQIPDSIFRRIRRAYSRSWFQPGILDLGYFQTDITISSNPIFRRIQSIFRRPPPPPHSIFRRKYQDAESPGTQIHRLFLDQYVRIRILFLEGSRSSLAIRSNVIFRRIGVIVYIQTVCCISGLYEDSIFRRILVIFRRILLGRGAFRLFLEQYTVLCLVYFQKEPHFQMRFIRFSSYTE